jgi:hypothetical protein
MKTVVWNMQHKPSNWAVLESSIELCSADVSLLCEASPAPKGTETVGSERTIGLEAPLLPDKPVDRPWSAVVASTHPLREIDDARVDRSYGEQLPFKPSRAGTWAAASIDVNGVPVTAISIYGLLDERSDASVHRSLSELSPIFDHEVYGKRLLLGGDINILAGRPPRARPDRSKVVLDRIEAYGLVDCLRKMRPSGPLEGCRCELGDACTHTWTKHVTPDAGQPNVPYQDDYLFASAALGDRLESCKALPFGDDSTSDHAPIIATFDLPAN